MKSTQISAPPERIAAHFPAGLKAFTPAGTLTLQSGVELAAPVVGYQTWGSLNAQADNVIWICHALTGTTDVASWWPGLFGPGKPLDPSQDFIVCANVLGGCYGSAGPTTHGGASFPEITVADMVQHQRLLLAHLGIKRIKLMLGGSMGGFQALEWALQCPSDIDALCLVATAAAQPAFAVALSELQNQQIRNDPNYCDGQYAAESHPDAGLANARMLGHLSYRTDTEFDARFGRAEREDGAFQAWSYLQHQGQKLVQRFDANTYLRLNNAMNRFDASVGRGDLRLALHRLQMPTLVVSIESDWLYPPKEQRVLASHVPRAKLKMLHSLFGHDGFLLEAGQFEPDLRQLLAQTRLAREHTEITRKRA
jgi:homoserine O-acetyltransferase/O-succinyltransferase